MFSASASHIVHDLHDSPIGVLLLLGDGERLNGLYMQDGQRPLAGTDGLRRASAPFTDVRRQLDEYFAGSEPGSTCRWT